MAVSFYQTYAGKTVYITSGDASQDETISGSIQQLSRVQSVSWGINYPLQDETYLDGGGEAFYPLPPSVDVSLDAFNTNGFNERFLGLGKLTPSGTLALGFEDQRNLYVSIEDNQGVDAIGAPFTGPRTVLGLSQGLLSTYQLSAAVGGLVESRANLNYLSAFILTGSSGLAKPSVDYQDGSQVTGRFVLPGPTSQYSAAATGTFGNVAAISARDMVMMFPDNSPFGVVFTGQQACYLQSMQLGITINRLALKPLGYVYPPDRPVIWPVQVDLNTEAIVNRYQADRLRRLACTVTGQSVYIAVKQPCSAITMFGFYFTDLQLTNQSFSANIGDTDRVSTQWRGWLRDPASTFISPFWNTIIRLDTSGAWGETW